MSGWTWIVFLLLSMLIGALIPNSRFKLISTAVAAVAPPVFVALAYHQASKTGCSGGDCAGPMIAIIFLGFAAGVMSCFAFGVFVQAALSMLLHKAARVGGSKRFAGSIRFLPLLVPLTIAGAVYVMTLRPPAPMPPDCDGRMATVRIGDAQFRFPVTSEVDIWPNDLRETAQSLSHRDTALHFCKRATKGIVPLAQLRFSSPHFAFRTSPQPWLARYFGAPPPAGPRSICNQAPSPDENRLFCNTDKAPSFTPAPSIPYMSIQLLPQGSTTTLRGPSGLMIKVTAANVTELLPTLAKSFPARAKVSDFEIYYDGPARLIYRSDGTRPMNIVNCSLERRGSLQCNMISFLDGRAEMRSMFFLPEDATDTTIVVTIERIAGFTDRLATEAG